MLAYFDRSGSGFLHYNEFMRLLQGTLDLAPEAPSDLELARRIPDIGDYRGRDALLGNSGTSVSVLHEFNVVPEVKQGDSPST